MIYLDNAATTAVSQRVFEAMTPYLREEYGNAGSVHRMGRHAAQAIDKAREQVAGMIGAEPEQIIFTSGGTEANSLAIHGIRRYLIRYCGRIAMLTSCIEHDSVLRAVKTSSYYDAESKFFILPVDERGCISSSELRRILDKRLVDFVSVMYVNNEVGSVNDIASIGSLCQEYNVRFHTDCVQAAGTFPLDVEECHCDLMSISGHKIHAPKGVGALYVRDRHMLSPLIRGGNAQEFGLRGGTENVAGIVGFGQACEIAAQELEANTEQTVKHKQLFYQVLTGILGEVKVNGLSPNETGKVLSLTFPDIDAETLLMMLDTHDICVSAGSACRSHESEPSHVLTAMGLSDDDARSTIRVSFSEMNTQNDAINGAQILADCVSLLRGA